MDNRQQREFLSNLTRAHINQLCLEMQSIISNFKTYLAETHGYSESEITKIMLGAKFEDLDTFDSQDLTPSSNTGDQKQNTDSEPTRKAESFVQDSPHDLMKLKKEDEMIRRSMMFELEWCVAQIERGNNPQ